MKRLSGNLSGDLKRLVDTRVWRPIGKNGEDYGVEIRIEIFELPDGRFVALPDRMIKTPKQSSPYMSVHPQDSVEGALNDCLNGFKVFMGDPETTEWPFRDNSYGADEEK